MKTAKIFFLSAILILTYVQSFAQGGWTFLKNAGSENINVYIDMLEKADGSILACGIAGDGSESQNYIVHLTSDGQTIWETFIEKDPDYFVMGKIIMISDGGYIVCGNNKIYDIPWILKVDSNGVILWDSDVVGTAFPHLTSEDNYPALFQISSDKIAVFCESASLFTEQEGFAYIINQFTGELISSDTLGIPGFENAPFVINDFTLTHDGGIVLTGTKNDFGSFAFVWKLNSFLESEWVLEYGTFTNQVNPFGIKEAEDEGFIITGYIREDDNQTPFLLRLDHSGAVIWEQEYPDTEYNISIGWDVTEKADNNLAVLQFMFNDVTYEQKMVIITFGPEGDAIDEKILPESTHFQFTKNIISALDGGIIFSTAYTAFPLNEFAILKSSSSGDLPECIFNCTWPGDANNDSTPNMDDLLTLGIAYSASGPERTSADNFWYAHTSDVWADSLADGTNYKYADCNGDGIINDDDTLAISVNYGMEHPVYTLRTAEDIPEIYLAPVSDTLPLGLVEIPVMLGDDTDPMELYGIKFSITYSDDEVIDSTTMHFNFDACWLGEDDELLTMQKTLPALKTIDVGITRNDHTNITGGGQVGTLSFVVVDNIAGKTTGGGEVTMSVHAVHAIKNNEEDVLVNGSDYTFKLFSALYDQPAIGFTLYPNPANDFIYFTMPPSEESAVTIQLYDITGKNVKSFQGLEMQQGKLYTGDLAPGVYTCHVNTSFGTHTQKVILVR